MRVALVHHWFITRGGGERVAQSLASLLPTAELFTLVSDDHGLPPELQSRPLHTSFLQRVPGARRFHRHMLPLYPAATESLDLRGFELVISSDSGPVKGVRLDAGATHICFCHSPMRYLYDGYEAYRAQMSGLTRLLFTATAGRVRRWDTAAAARVTHFVANSRYVAARIARCYGRESTVIYPPIDLDLARPATPGPHYLAAGRLVPYKRTELMIEACQRLGRTLRVVGTGPELSRLRRLAGAETTFLGELSNEALWQEYAHARALLFAADEDLGMVPLEAQACGRPVIAYGIGGSLETVRSDDPSPTGIFFGEQTAASLADGMTRFEAVEAGFDPNAIAMWAQGFGTERFLAEMRSLILRVLPAAAVVLAPERAASPAIPAE